MGRGSSGHAAMIAQRRESKERFWRRHVAEQKAGARTIRDYCGEHDLSEPSFYAWRRNIAHRDRAEQRAAIRDAARSALSADAATDFVRFEMAPALPAVQPPIEVLLPDGVRLLVAAGASSELVCAVLSALRGVSGKEGQSC